MPYGLLTTGYSPKSQPVIRDELNTSIRAKRGPSTDMSDGSLLGQWAAIHAEREGLMWDLGGMIVASQDPDMAVGQAHDAVCALTGSLRDGESASIVTATLTGVPTTTVPALSQVKTLSTGKVFKTDQSKDIVALAAWVAGHAYVLDDRVTNAGRVYVCITAGTSAGSGGPTTTSADITDNTAHWRYCGEGTGAVDVTMTSIELDEIICLSGDLTDINTPIGGWQSCINLNDAVTGEPEQTDESLRISRSQEISDAGTGTTEAVAAALRKVAGVTYVAVYENDQDATDGNGQPGHSIQPVILGGADSAIAAVLHANNGGVRTFGTSNATVTDSQGFTRTYYFTRPATVNIYVDVTLKYNPADASRGGYPSDGNNLVKSAITTAGNALGTGRDVVSSFIGSAAFPIFINGQLALGVQGVTDVTTTKIGTAPSPSATTTIVITPFQVPVFDTSRVTVNATAGSI